MSELHHETSVVVNASLVFVLHGDPPIVCWPSLMYYQTRVVLYPPFPTSVPSKQVRHGTSRSNRFNPSNFNS